MTAKELAGMLSGREYGMEITRDEAQQAADADLVVVYGHSDDNVEFCGAIDDEVGAYDGTTVYLTKDGLISQEIVEDCGECPYFAKAREKAKTIKAVWHDKGGPCWTFETDIPPRDVQHLRGWRIVLRGHCVQRRASGEWYA